MQEPFCQRCNCKPEDVFHALVDCKQSRKVWIISEFLEVINDAASSDILLLLHNIANKHGRSAVEKMVSCCWSIWWVRNQLVMQGKTVDPTITLSKVEAVRASFQRIRGADPEHLQTSLSKNLQFWNPPTEGWLNMNIDASVNKELMISRLGVVVRNNRGQVMAAAVRSTFFRGDVARVEAEVVLWGL